MSNKDKANNLIKLVGGKENISNVVNCMTRVRFYLKDKSKIDLNGLENEDYVIGVNDAGEQYHVIVGPGHAQKITTEITSILDLENTGNEVIEEDFEQEWKENKEKYKKKNVVGDFLKKIGEVFIPMIPGFIAAGIFLGISNIIGNLNVGSETLPAAYYFFNMIGMALYGYLVIFTGINTAKVFGGTEILGGIIGGLTVSQTLIPFFTALGFSETFASSMPGKGGIFGVLFAVVFMSFVEKKLRKIVPGILDLILTPILTLIITGLVTIFVFMFLAGELTIFITFILNTLVGTTGVLSVLSGGIIAGFFLPLVTFGLHQGFTPIYIDEIQRTGVTLIFPIAAMAGAGQVGAALSIFFQAKKIGDTRMQKIISGAIIPGFLGVGEPLIYGVTLPLGKPFITAGLGAAVGGAFIAFTHVGAVATGPSGLTALPLIQIGQMHLYLFGLIIAYTFGFIFTHLFFDYKKRVNK